MTEEQIADLIAERDQAVAAVERVRELADEFDANFNWRGWGIGNRIRHAVCGSAS